MAPSDKGAPPLRPPPPPDKEPPSFPHPRDRQMVAGDWSDILQGRWVTSYSGWIHVFPKPVTLNPNTPPQIAGYGYDPNTDVYEQREGYFAFAALACFRFHEGTLVGHVEANRGGREHRSYDVTGTYTIQWDPQLHVYRGTFTTVQPGGPGGSPPIEMTYHYLIKNFDEVEWVWTSGNYRGFVTHGTLMRVKTVPL